MGFWTDREGRRQGRADRDPRGPGPQPEGAGLRHPEEPPRRGHGPLGLRQEQPRLRHPLRRGPAPLRREPLPLGPPVPGADGAAGGRVGDRPLPGDRDRAAHHGRAPPFHRGHGDRDLRPPAGPLRDPRPAPLPPLRRARRRAERGRDGRAPPGGVGGLRRGHRRPRRARPEGGLPQGAGRGPRGRAAARAHRRPRGRPGRPDVARPAPGPPRRRAGGPARPARGGGGPPARGPREGPRPRGGRRPRVRRGPRGAPAEPAPRVCPV